jgi:UDP-N-acetyl-D-glucosamine dehydrogenase
MKSLEDLISSRQALVGVVGLGYVGLPLAVEFASAGMQVLGFDMQSTKVDSVNAGESYIADVPSERLAPLARSGRLTATSDFSDLSRCDAICICVPTPLDKNKVPDISYVASTADNIANTLRDGQLIVLESTTYPGTTEEIILPRLEATGRKVGRDFFLAFSPERIDPGRKDYTTQNTPKVVGGVTEQCTELAAILYECFNSEIHRVSSPRVAEMEKLLENIFRLVNVSLVNEMALLCDRLDIDVWEVIDAASTKPYGFMPFYPGPGLGGHCIPIDPFYLSWKAREVNFTPRFVELAGDINDHMPHFVVTKIIVSLNRQKKCLNGSSILALGAAYKKDVSDIRESPAIEIMSELKHKMANISYNDPYVPTIELRGTEYQSVELTDEALAAADCVVILTDHSDYDFDRIAEKAKLVVDTRNGVRRRDLPHVFHL